MNRNRLFAGAAVLVLAAALAVNGCSSGSSGGASKQTSKGIISGFGSVIVNGVHYDSSAAGVTIDGVSSAETDLKIGMEVTVKGNGTVASTIEAADALEGPVAAIDTAAGTFSVLGQTVQTDNLTSYETVTGLATLANGSIVEVSGLVDGLGVIHASRVELKTATPAPTAPIEVKGTVSVLDTTARTFKLNSLTVDYTAATLNDFPTAGIADGQFVEVKSTVGGFNAGTNTLSADVVELEPSFSASAGEHVEIKGYVSNFVSLSDFTVNDVAVNAGSTGATGIVDGILVEVEGYMDANGVLIATAVTAEQESDIVLEGDAATVDAAAGIVTLLSNTVRVSATTELRDSSAAQVRMFSPGDIASGDHLEIAGYLNADGSLNATKVERLDPSTQAVLQGKVTSKTASSLVILGVTIATDGATAYRDRSSAAMTGVDFFAAVTVNTTLVKAQWDALGVSGLAAPVNELELESTP